MLKPILFENPLTWRLAANDVQIWQVPLKGNATEIKNLTQLLSPEEQARAAKFIKLEDKVRFIIARGMLRQLLGHYLQQDPVALAFAYNAHGKPQLTNSNLQFNLSHARDLALYAFAWDMPLGVDIEYQRSELAMLEIAERFFAPSEYIALKNLPATEQRLGFFNAWTRKEAFIKALGKGLAYSLKEFAVSLAPAEPVQLLHVEAGMNLQDWTLLALTPAANFSAALAVQGQPQAVHYWQLKQAAFNPGCG